MKQYFTKKALKIFLGYTAIFSIVIYFVIGNQDIVVALLFGFILTVALFYIDSANPKYKKED